MNTALLKIYTTIFLMSLATTSWTQSSSSFGDPLVIPVKVKTCDLAEEFRFAVRVRSKSQYEARTKYPVQIEQVHVKKGERVKKGQLLVSTVTKELTQMRSIYLDYQVLYGNFMKVIRNELKMTSARRDRLKGLVKKGVIAQSEMDDVEKQVLASAGNVERYGRELENIKTNITQYTDQIRAANFYSEIDGLVTSILDGSGGNSKGAYVYPGTPLIRVEVPGEYIAESSMIDTQIHQVKLGRPATIELLDGSRYQGTVTFISPQANVEANRQSSLDNYSSSSNANQSSAISSSLNKVQGLFYAIKFDKIAFNKF